MIISAIIAILIGGGTYMIMQRGMMRLIIGITLISHGVNLLILTVGVGAWRAEPLMDRTTPGAAADALPQAFVLTAIVISMASTAVMLALAAIGRDDDTRGVDDPEKGWRKARQLQTMGSGTHRAGMDDKDTARAHAETNQNRHRAAAETAAEKQPQRDQKEGQK